MQLLSDKYINVDGINTRYWEAGDADRPHLLLIHGIGASVEYWYANIQELSQHYHVVALDLPGFGKSDKPNIDYSLDFYEKFLLHFVDALHMTELSVIAHSLGGAVALGFVIDHLLRIKKLVLIDNVGFALQVIIFFRLMGLPIVGPWLLNLNKEMFSKALRTNVYKPEVITDEFIDTIFQFARHVDVQRTMRHIVKNNTNLFGITKKALNPLWTRFNVLKDLPILLFWGKNDRLLSCEEHTAAAKRYLPHVKLYLLEECGHIPQMEYAEKFNQLTLEFLQE